MFKFAFKWLTGIFLVIAFLLPSTGVNGGVAVKSARNGHELLIPVFTSANLEKIENATFSAGVTVTAPVLTKLRTGFCHIDTNFISLPFSSHSFYFSTGNQVRQYRNLFIILRRLLI